VSDTPASARRSFSPWWALLLLPIGVGVGWLAGQMPVPAPRAPAAAAPGDQPPAAHRERAGEQASGNGPGFAAPTTAAAPADSAKPTEQRPEYSQWTTYSSAVEQSRRNGKPILIDFNAEWCGPCQRLKREVFEDGARAQIVQTEVIPVSIVDRQQEEGRNPSETEELQRRYQVNAFPTLVVFSPQSGRMYTTRGFGDAEETLTWITQAARAVR
jgi:thiol-disulfide isomerase/thioredoxin